jgi:hypothetical protein
MVYKWGEREKRREVYSFFFLKKKGSFNFSLKTGKKGAERIEEGLLNSSFNEAWNINISS